MIVGKRAVTVFAWDKIFALQAFMYSFQLNKCHFWHQLVVVSLTLYFCEISVGKENHPQAIHTANVKAGTPIIQENAVRYALEEIAWIVYTYF